MSGQAIVPVESVTPQLLTQAMQMLAKAETLPEILKIRSMATAAEHYFKAASRSREIANDAVEIRLRAERKAGELLRLMAERGERARAADNLRHSSKSRDVSSTLSDLAITHMQSARWQAIESVPIDIFESYIQKTRLLESGELTTSALMHMAKKADRKSKQEESSNDPDELPSPEEARRIAIETGQSVLDSEGWYQPPISVERQEEIARTLDLLDLISELAESELLKYEPRDLLYQFAGLRKRYHSRLRELSLEKVIAWLVEFENERKKDYGERAS